MASSEGSETTRDLQVRTDAILPRALEFAVRFSRPGFFSERLDEVARKPNIVEDSILQSFYAASTELYRYYRHHMRDLAENAARVRGGITCDRFFRMAEFFEAFADDDESEGGQDSKREWTFSWGKLLAFIIVTCELSSILERKRSRKRSPAAAEKWKYDDQEMFSLMEQLIRNAFKKKRVLERIDPERGWFGLVDFNDERITTRLEFTEWFDGNFAPKVTEETK